MAHFTSFLSLFESAVLPLIQQHPTWTRLDGKTSGGNRTPFATFEYVGKKWRLHSDSKIEPLLKAWNMEKEGPIRRHSYFPQTHGRLDMRYR